MRKWFIGIIVMVALTVFVLTLGAQTVFSQTQPISVRADSARRTTPFDRGQLHQCCHTDRGSSVSSFISALTLLDQ